MKFAQYVFKDNEWKHIQTDQYAMEVSKFCRRLCERAGVRSEYTSALKKNGSIIFENNGNIIKMEIEAKDGKFTGKTRDFTGKFTPGEGAATTEPAASEGDRVHA